MSSIIKSLLPKYFLAFFKYIKIHRILYPFFGGCGVILVLHRVLPASGKPRITANSRIEITPGFLEELILFFKNKNYDIISLDELHDRLEADKKNKPFVCFTFDDGYADAHEIVYPIFKKHQLPYAVYVTTCFPDKTAMPWWYMLEDLVLKHDLITFTKRGEEHIYKAGSTEEKEAAFDNIRGLILNTPFDELENFIKEVFSPYNISIDDYNSQLMDWQQVNELSNDPLVTLGAHTVNHLNLRRLPSEQVTKEIQLSKSIIEQKTGKPVSHFAYPFGSRVEVGSRDIAIAANSGFKTMTTVREGNIFPDHRHHLQCLPRVEITGRHQDLTLIDMRRCGTISLLRNGWRRLVTV